MKFRTLVNNIKIVFSRNGLKIGTNSKLVDDENRLNGAILSGIYYMFGILIICTLICLGTGFNLLILFFAIFPLPIMMAIDYYCGFTERCGIQYHRFLIVLLAVINPMFFTISVAASILILHIYQYAIGLGLAVICPNILLLWNIDSFNVRKTYFGPEKRVDPYPIGLWLSSSVIGGITTAWGITYLIMGHTSTFPALFLILEGLLIQSIFAFPHKINKIVPLDLEGSSGPCFMILLTLTCLMIIHYIPIP